MKLFHFSNFLNLKKNHMKFYSHSEQYVAKSKLPPRSGSSLQAVEPHP